MAGANQLSLANQPRNDIRVRKILFGGGSELASNQVIARRLPLAPDNDDVAWWFSVQDHFHSLPGK